MWISEIELNNFRSFPDAKIQLSKGINLIVGSNNAGKSSLLRAILWLQQGFDLSNTDLRISTDNGYIQLLINDINEKLIYNPNLGSTAWFKLTLLNNTTKLEVINTVGDKKNVFLQNTGVYNFNVLNQEPKNFIYPYLSKRKVIKFEETINLLTANLVTGNLSHLPAKIDRISNPQLPANEQYVQSCENILGFQITTTPSHNGKLAAYIVSNHENISLDAMGEGVANLVGLIADLCMAKNQLFLIEEPENDVHPKALKKLLALIKEKSVNNQFIITTHSNIVAKYLGASPDSKLFSVSIKFENRLPTSHIEEIDNTPEARRQVLEELGYDFFDFDLWSAWLILEESSAERIIRDYLIPWFVPALQGRLRTYSANSLSEVETKFRDFDNLFVFLHLQSIYKNKAWVIVDEGEKEREIIEKLRTKYSKSGWNENNFLQLSQHDFERYYPSKFQVDVDNILQMPSGKHKQERKKSLLEEVMKWMKEKPEEAEIELHESAAEVINILKRIQQVLSVA
ncbi:MAG TPA: AAA family ATPase [Leptolyngbyaceae cyanobacterium]